MDIIHAMNALPRAITRRLELALDTMPVCVVTGARQTGKTTLVRGLAGDHRTYVTLDDVDTLVSAQQAADALVKQGPRMILDEVQRAPGLLLAVKRAVDARRVAGQFILTGSANLLLMRQVTETLAGRAAYLALWPMTRREQRGLGTAGIWSAILESPHDRWADLVAAEKQPRELWRDLALRGGYPVPAHDLHTADQRALWFTGYEKTYLERDVQDLVSVTSIVDFRRLIRAACLRIGGLVNQTEIARDVGLSQPTVHRHLDALEASYQLVRVHAFAPNRTKRLIKSPKLYWADTGLALHLAGEREPRGAHFENLVLSDLLAWKSSVADEPEVLHWRAASGEEVDFVLEWQGRLLPIEVKASAKPRLDDARGISSFRAEYGKKALPGLVVHDGDEIRWLSNDALAVPWWRVM
jgi:predicted AAA+ superfamily ATPase